MKTEYMIGLPVDVVTISDILNELPARLANQEKITYTSINPQIITHAHQYPEVVAFIKASTYRIPDGIGIVKASKMQGGQITERVAGIELMYALLGYASDNQLRIFLYGAAPSVVAQAALNITTQYPGVSVAGYLDGYTDLSDQEIVQQINASQADMVFVALGFPKQERWLANNYQRVNAQVFQDVGGSLDVISGQVKRAPAFFIKTNLEWAYRSLRHPKRLYRIFELPVFMWRTWQWHRKNKNETN